MEKIYSLYVLKISGEVTKFGVTCNVPRRVRALMIENSGGRFIFSVDMKTQEDAMYIETALKRYYLFFGAIVKGKREYVRSLPGEVVSTIKKMVVFAGL